jgi:hypothetical protein
VASALSHAPALFKGMQERMSFRGTASQAGAAEEAVTQAQPEQGSSSAAAK